MKRIVIIALFFAVLIPALAGSSPFTSEAIQKVVLSDKEVPDGFIFGKIPPFAQKVLKGNPWMMDEKAIKKLADRIYPGGDARKISKMHVTIMANSNKPYGDDIVCYVILFRDLASAKEELEKMNKFAGYNRDRVILLTKENLAVFMFVDSIDNYHYLKMISDSMQERLKSL